MSVSVLAVWILVMSQPELVAACGWLATVMSQPGMLAK